MLPDHRSEPMSVASSSTPSAVATAARHHRSLRSMYLELTKARLSAMVLLTTATGYVLASTGAIDWVRFAATIVGTALAAGAANTLNQVREIGRDRCMHRTAGRPLPAGSIDQRHALRFGALLGYAGVALLTAMVNWMAASLALITIAVYVLVYTPLKPRTSLNTLVGAVCGALPPMIGWVGASATIAPGAWLLAMLLFVWQLPHFLALAWLYREDYGRGGFLMLPNVDPRGELTGRVAFTSSLVLMLVGIVVPLIGLAGWLFGLGATLLGVWMAARAWGFARRRNDDSARRLFQASLLYLPLILGLLLLDRGPLP
jgi:protoheme IX farnesyltransferase